MAEPVELRQRGERREEPGGPAKEEQKAQSGNRGRFWLIGAALLIVALVVGYFIQQDLSKRESTDDAQVEGHISSISARVSGTVVAVNIQDNQQVQAGTVLFQIDPADYKVAVEQAKAELAEAEADARGARSSVPVTSINTRSTVSSAEAGERESAAGVVVAQKNVATAQAKVKSAQARQQEAEANSTKAAKDLERYKLLVAKDEISRQQYDAAVAAADGARAAVESSRASVNEAEQGVAAAESQVQQARAQQSRAEAGVRAASSAPEQVAVTQAQAGSAGARVQQKKAELDKAELNLQYTTVRAPFTGVVGNKTVQIGQTAQAGQQMLVLIPLEEVWVTANFKESQLNHIRPGQPATFSVDAYGGREYKGHVDTIAAATGARFSLLPPENATGNYVKVVQRMPVKIALDEQNTDHLLRPGMSVNVKVQVK